MKTRLLIVIMAAASAALAQNGLPTPGPGNVTLPLDEYNRLLEIAAKPPKAADTPLLPYVIRTAQMNLQVKGEIVEGTVALEGEVFAAGDVQAAVAIDTIVRSAQQKGKDLPVVRDAAVHRAVLSGPGEFALSMETASPLIAETGRASFRITTPLAGAVRLALTIPGEQTLVHLDRGLITAQSSRDGRTFVEATLVPGQAATVWWAARLSVTQAPPDQPKEARFLSDVKTLVSLTQADVSLATLAEITVVQGEPAQFRARAPEGYEFTGATGPTLSSAESQGEFIVLHVTTPASRSHQFLITMARANRGAAAQAPIPWFAGAQRETGEVLVEGEGALELTSSGTGGLRRMDLKETSPQLRSMARGALHAGFRYQKRAAESPAVALEWVRFPDSDLPSAIAQNAVVTTLITSEGRSLTEVRLTVTNQAQPFLKAALPAGATILSAEVAGEKVKPVQGADGSRVPLVRPGFHPPAAYPVSFVFLQSGSAFDKKGAARLELPKMDIPIGVTEWEVFLPQQYRVSGFGGDVTAARLLPAEVVDEPSARVAVTTGFRDLGPLMPGQIGGLITDPAGAVIPNATIVLDDAASGRTWKRFTDMSGRWVANVPSGRLRVSVTAPGFRTEVCTVDHDASRGTRLSVALDVGSVSESVEVTAQADTGRQSRQVERTARQNAAAADAAPSQNVTDLQRRVVGVLPIAINVPRSGNAYRFVRPLVVDEPTALTFKYRRK